MFRTMAWWPERPRRSRRQAKSWGRRCVNSPAPGQPWKGGLTMLSVPDPVPRRRCPRCGHPVIRYEQEVLCLDCTRWTLGPAASCAGCGDDGGLPGLAVWTPREEAGDYDAGPEGGDA